jgi:hypothetical protein
LGWGLTQRVDSWVAWEGKVWLFFETRRWDLFLIFQRIILLVVWDGVFGKNGWVFVFFGFFGFFCDMVM